MATDLTVVVADHVEATFRVDAEPLCSLPPRAPFVVHSRSLHTDDAFDRSVDYTELSIPLTGPLDLQGVRAGDRIRIDIHEIEVASRGAMVTLPGRGGFSQPLRTTGRSLHIAEGVVAFSEGVDVPVRPMIGKLGVGVPGEPPGSSTVGRHGGNLDCKDITADSAVFLTALVDGAFLYLGDLHACQGDGESSLTGVEVEGSVTLSWDYAAEASVASDRPMVLTADGRVLTIGDGATLDEAVQCALDDMLAFTVKAHDWTREKAAMFLSIAADVGVCQVVNPRMSAKVAVPVRYFDGTPCEQWLHREESEGDIHA